MGQALRRARPAGSGMTTDRGEPSEHGGDGRRDRHPLRDVYQPENDDEGAAFAGLLTEAQQKEKRRAERD